MSFCVGDEGTASVHSHSSTGYHSGFHSSAGLHSGSSSSMTIANSNHLTPPHNSIPATKLQHPHKRSMDYISPQSCHHEDTVYNGTQVYSQGYMCYPGAVINSSPSTSRMSQFEHVITSKVSCPMAKVAPYSAQVNRVVTMPTSSSSISADSTPYHQDVTDCDTRSPHMMRRQMKALSLGEEGMYGQVEVSNYSKWNGLIELKDQIMMQKDQLVERYIFYCMHNAIVCIMLNGMVCICYRHKLDNNLCR